MFIFWLDDSPSTLGFGLGPTVTKTKQTADQLSLGPTEWVELLLGLKVAGLNVNAPFQHGLWLIRTSKNHGNPMINF
jgi:hypothetical protein